MASHSPVHVWIFCDGACSGNPGPGGWAAVIREPNGNVHELGGGDRSTTNNQMEVMAAIEALKFAASKQGPVDLFTDSAYLIRGITQWVWGWRKRGWKTAEGNDVANQDLWERLVRIVSARGPGNSVRWHYVRGHQGTPGNERCDQIAVAYSKGQRPNLFSGSESQYNFDLSLVPDDTSVPEMSSTPKDKKAPPYSYLSLIGSVVERHSTWAECERRVKGQSGAKFKKALSQDDEEKILRDWGVTFKKSP